MSTFATGGRQTGKTLEQARQAAERTVRFGAPSGDPNESVLIASALLNCIASLGLRVERSAALERALEDARLTIKLERSPHFALRMAEALLELAGESA